MNIELFKKVEKIKQKYINKYPCLECDGTGVKFSDKFTRFCFWCDGSGIDNRIWKQYQNKIKELNKQQQNNEVKK